MDEDEHLNANSRWSIYILRRSLRFGKKAAIAGAVITSAPVIIPSLFVLSTLTIAFSVPFGIYLAGYVCADEFMSFLLPLAEEIDDGVMESEDLMEVGLDSGHGDEIVLGDKNREKSACDLCLESLTEEIDNGVVESEDLIEIGLDTEQGAEMVLGEKNRDKSAYDLSLNSFTEEIDDGSMELEDLLEIGLDSEHGDGMVLGEKTRDRSAYDFSHVSLTEDIDNGFMKSDDFIEGVLDTENFDEMVLSKKNRDKGEIDNGSMESGDLINRGLDTEQSDEMVLCKKSRDKGEIHKGEKARTEEKIGEENEMVKSAGLTNDAAITEDLRKSVFPNAEYEDRGKEVIRKSPYSVVIMAANKESSKKEYESPNLSSEHLSIVEEKANDIPLRKELREDSGVEAKEKESSLECSIEVPRLKSDCVLSAVIVPSRGEDVEILEKVGSLEHRNVGKLVPAASVGVGVTALHSHHERTHNEEQLWDQIFSIRTIVGYKATLKPSLWEEIVALYLMIGMKPPFSLKDYADLTEINNNIQFLKYVVGVK